MPSTYIWTHLALSLTILSVGATAQSVCDSTQCPRESYYKGGCALGEINNATHIGITTYDKNMLSPEPITWAAAVSSEGGNHAESMRPDVYERSYFLGTPASFDSNKSDDICVLIFEGVTKLMRFTNEHPEVSTGTCEDGFVESLCYEAFQGHIKSAVEKISDKGGDKCKALQKAMEGSAPEECKDLATRGSWGEIKAKQLSELTAIESKNRTCHPTLAQEYNLSVAATFKYPIDNGTGPGVIQNEFQFIRAGVTPIVMVNLGNGGDSSSNATNLEVACVRPMPGTLENMSSSEGEDSEVSASSRAWQSVDSSVLLGAILGLVMCMQLLLG